MRQAANAKMYLRVETGCMLLFALRRQYLDESMRDDFQLLQEHIERNSEEAFRAIVERHAGMVHGTALRIVRDAAVAEEISQAVFILLARKASTLSAGIVLAGWLYQTTRYVALGALRAERRRQQHHREFALMNDSADPAAVWDQIRPHLDESIAQLGPGDRNALVLRYLEGRSFAEVGAALGTSESAAKMRVGRALDKLRHALGRRGVIVTLAVLAPALTANAAPVVPTALLAQIASAVLTASAPAPSLLTLINEAIKLMTLQKLKAALIAAAMTLLLIGGGVAVFLVSTKPGQPPAHPLRLMTFEPMAGEWEGTYVTHQDGQPDPPQQRVALSIRTAERGRLCEIDMSLLDRNDQATTTYHFTHALNATGDRIITTDDLGTGRVSLDGPVTEAVHNAVTGEWRAAFRASRPKSADVTECRWARLGDDLTISREDMTATPQGSSRLFSDLTLRPRSTKPRTAFTALPRGTQIFDGVTFLIQKPINIIGARAGRAKGRALARVTDSTIHGRGRHIHVLHTGDHGASPTGNYIWRLVLHYEDGESERFDFAYGVHLRNYWRRGDDGQRTPTDPDSSIAWVGTSAESDRTGAELVVSRTTLENPRPNVEVTSAEFVSLLGESSAYVLAVTVNDGGPQPVHKERLSAPNVPPFTFQFQNAAGQPQARTALDCEFECDGFSVRLAQVQADDKGRITIDVPKEVVYAIEYQARHPDGRIASGGIQISATDKAWPLQVVRFPD